ncbi:MAG: transcriptional regulator NrdR [Dehalococcoidales bacterium]|nr:transcriptional regulator NrdR [Dehalococcoidales bacterium]
MDDAIRRRRECSACGQRFTTFERVDRLRCPRCGAVDSKVSAWRDLEHGLRRHRECPRCGRRFTSTERVDTVSVLVVKKDGRREEFNRGKLLEGIRKACSKRPVLPEQMEVLADEIEAALFSTGLPEIESHQIGELVVERLRDLDLVAYIRFASVYRPLEDLESIRRELDALLQAKSVAAKNGGGEAD